MVLNLTWCPDLSSALMFPQNPDIVLVHYLNVPAIEDCGKPCGPILCSINTDKKEWAKWTKEELVGQLKPMCEYYLGPVLHLLPNRGFQVDSGEMLSVQFLLSICVNKPLNVYIFYWGMSYTCHLVDLSSVISGFYLQI